MHGLIFMELQKFVEQNYDNETWFIILEKANLTDQFFLPINTYPDENAINIVVAASQLTGLSVNEILDKFGEFIVPDLMRMFKSYIKQEWKTLDFLQNTETTIHKAVRATNPGAEPPELKITRVNNNEIEILYYSKRQMLALALGMIKGVAKYYGETDNIIVKTTNIDSLNHKVSVLLK